MSSIIDYEVVACSSEDKEMQRYISSLKEFNIIGNKVCWVTDKKRSYPQSLTIRLLSAATVGRVDVVVHPKLIPSTITVAFGVTTRGGGRANDAKYSIRGTFHFVVNGIISERQTLYCEDPAEFIRFTVHGYYDTGDNVDRQVCIAAIVIRTPGDLFSDFGPNNRSSPSDDLLSRSITTIRNPVLDEKLQNPLRTRSTSPVRTPTPSKAISPARAPSRTLVSPFDPAKHGIKLDATPPRGASPHRRSPLPIPPRSPTKRRPSPAPPATLPKGNIQHLINSDSEDEEVIFTKSMVQRLKGKIRDQEGGADSASTSDRPNSTGSKTPTRSPSRSSSRNRERPDSVQIRRPMGINGKEARSKTPDLDSKSVKSADSGTQSLPDGDRPLTPR